MAEEDVELKIEIAYGVWYINKPRGYHRKYFWDTPEDQHCIPLYVTKKLEDYMMAYVMRMEELYPQIMKKRSNANSGIEFTSALVTHPMVGEIQVIECCSVADNFERKEGHRRIMDKMEKVLHLLDTVEQRYWDRVKYFKKPFVSIEKL
jgi:hypothetical protein